MKLEYESATAIQRLDGSSEGLFGQRISHYKVMLPCDLCLFSLSKRSRRRVSHPMDKDPVVNIHNMMARAY